MDDTIFACSSGAPPSAIAVIRVSGPRAEAALTELAGRTLPARTARLVTLRNRAGEALDRALALRFPGPATATGEDIAELHCHGGRAVVAAVETALSGMEGLRKAEPGEFTRRAFANGRIDLAEAEGLADLLAAETEWQRRAALAQAGGAFSAIVETWREAVLMLSAEVESALDFADESDVPADFSGFGASLSRLMGEMQSWLDRPAAERLRDGIRIVLAGPPNAGKSSLFNSLIESDAAIATPIAGTTRDLIERPVAISGIPFLFQDTAGLRETGDAVETIGVERALAAVARADIVLWLGAEGEGPDGAWEIATMTDLDKPAFAKLQPRFSVSAATGAGVDVLRRALVDHARTLLPPPGEAALNARQRDCVAEALRALQDGGLHPDLLVRAELLRVARVAFDRLLGRATTEDMLDRLFGRFCIGK